MDESSSTTQSSPSSEGRIEEIFGRIKEAAGVLFGNRDMKREGRADQWTGQAKSTASEAIDDVHDSVESLVDKVDSDEDEKKAP